MIGTLEYILFILPMSIECTWGTESSMRFSERESDNSTSDPERRRFRQEQQTPMLIVCLKKWERAGIRVRVERGWVVGKFYQILPFTFCRQIGDGK